MTETDIKATTRRPMKIRCKTVLISCVLFTIALIGFAPKQIEYALELRSYHSTMLHGLGRELVLEIGYKGLFSLTIILIGLIVVWTGYLQMIRWAWTIMFVIMFSWAFPGIILPMITTVARLPLSDWSVNSETTKHIVNLELIGAGEITILFVLMIIALVLPVKAFFGTNRSSRE